MGRRYALRDGHWHAVKRLLPGDKKSVGATARGNRFIAEAVLYRYHAVISWRDLPERFGDWKNAFERLSRRAESGILQAVFVHLVSDAGSDYAIFGSAVERAHQHSAGAREKTSRRSKRAKPKRVAHQNPRNGRFAGLPDVVPSDSWPGQ